MELIVLNTNFESVAIIDTFKSLIWTDRYNAYGDFEIYTSMTSDILDYIKEDYYVWLKESDHQMIVEDIQIDSDSDDGDHLKVTGRSLESILERRIVYGQKNLTGNLQEAIHELLNENFISPTDEKRRIDNFIFEENTDSRITELTVDTQYTGDDLYTIITKQCETNNIGFKIVLNDNNQFVFSLYVGEDRSYDQVVNPYVVFSPKFENIITSNYYYSKASYKNVTLVAGEGEGAERKTTEIGTASGIDRRELFTDARDISSNTDEQDEEGNQITLSDEEYIALLEARGTESLSETIIQTAFEGKVEASKLFKYGVDFFIGDIVQNEDAYGHSNKTYISELIFSQDESDVSIYPTFKTVQEGGNESL